MTAVIMCRWPATRDALEPEIVATVEERTLDLHTEVSVLADLS